MIASRIDRKTVDNYIRLAEYVAAAREEGEKLDQFWMANFKAGDTLEDLDLALIEADVTQAMNQTVKNDKTYHLVVSFRDEIPSPEVLKDIEQNFADALGFGEHQRVAATHSNTDNYHLHVAINRIHPETYKAHMPYMDFRILEKTAREMEKKWDLKVDLGAEDKIKSSKASQKARKFEAYTWEQSFDSYVHERKDRLIEASRKASNWQDLHRSFKEHNLVIKPRGNGFVIASADGLHGMKASGLDRSFSKPALEKRFGRYQRPDKTLKAVQTALQSYDRKPATRHHDQTRLWKKFVQKPRRKEHVAVTAIKTWKQYLAYEALNDPLAIAIIQYHKRLFKSLKPASKKQKNKNQDLNL